MTGTPDQDPYGFILVTSDPPLLSGKRGQAWDLVRARLASRQWPIYERTRGRRAMGAGSHLAFYVGGDGPNAGMIVATATVEAATPVGRVRRRVDPPEYYTDEPSVVLALREIEHLPSPIEFRAALPSLSIKPKNMQKWGIILHGGSRALTQRDWKELFSAT